MQLLRVMSTQGNRPIDAWPYEFRMSDVSCVKVNDQRFHVSLFYRPHPKDDGRLCFHKNLLTGAAGYPHPANGGTSILSDQGVTLSFLMGATPIFPDGGYPNLPDRGGTPSC